jgi:hypothetical protein
MYKTVEEKPIQKKDEEKRLRIPVMANSDSEGSRTAIPDDSEQLSGGWRTVIGAKRRCL